MNDGVYVRVTYHDEICFEQKFRVLSGDTIVLSVDDLVAEKVAAEREACAKLCEDLPADELITRTEATVWDIATLDCAAAIRKRGAP